MAETNNQIVVGGNDPNFTTRGGAPGSAGDDSIRVDRPNESLPGVATAGNYNPNSADGDSPLVNTRALMDSGKGIYSKTGVMQSQIDTTDTARIDRSAAVKQGNPSVW